MGSSVCGSSGGGMVISGGSLDLIINLPIQLSTRGVEGGEGETTKEEEEKIV